MYACTCTSLVSIYHFSHEDGHDPLTCVALPLVKMRPIKLRRASLCDLFWTRSLSLSLSLSVCVCVCVCVLVFLPLPLFPSVSVSSSKCARIPQLSEGSLPNCSFLGIQLVLRERERDRSWRNCWHTNRQK